jgi:ribonuclease HI
VLDDLGKPVTGHAGAFGRATNNVAEYRGLLEALALAERAGASDVKLYADSELVVKQMRGEYKVRHPDLIPLHAEAKRRASAFSRFSIEHVPRERNKDADRLVNRALNLGDGSSVEERLDTPTPAE